MPSKRTSPTPAKPADERKRRSGLARAFALLLALTALAVAAMFGSLPVQRATLPARDGKAIADARSWGYQLQNVRLRSLSEGADVLVVDYSRDGSDRRVLRPDEIERLRQRADGSRRIVLAYLSIGEAENYRYYWRQSWTPSDPAWLGPENTEWRGNCAVRYWMQGWKDFVIRPHLTMLGRLLEGVHPQQRPYLDRIIDAGFDGVYLDRVDAFDIWAKENPRAQLDMIAFVEEIAGYAHRRKKGFLVVAQNGEELLSSAAYRHAIDAVAKEDLLYGINGDETPNPAEDIARSIEHLDRLKAAGKPVFVGVTVNLADPASAPKPSRGRRSSANIFHFADRDLRQSPE